MKKAVLRLIIDVVLVLILFGAFWALASFASKGDIIDALVAQGDYVPALSAALAFLLRLSLIALVPGLLLYRGIVVMFSFKRSKR